MIGQRKGCLRCNWQPKSRSRKQKMKMQQKMREVKNFPHF